MTTHNFCVYLQKRLIQTGQIGGQWYSDTSPFSIPWHNYLSIMRWKVGPPWENVEMEILNPIRVKILSVFKVTCQLQKVLKWLAPF
jgi:hypothetical protein